MLLYQTADSRGIVLSIIRTKNPSENESLVLISAWNMDKEVEDHSKWDPNCGRPRSMGVVKVCPSSFGYLQGERKIDVCANMYMYVRI